MGYFKKDNGFSLIELLLVLAILSVLAVVSFQQLSLFRLRAADAAALSDINNLSKSQAGLTSAAQTYGITIDTGSAVVLLGEGVIVEGTSQLSDGIANMIMFVPISISSDVQLQTSTDIDGMSFIVLAKHRFGGHFYGIDSDD